MSGNALFFSAQKTLEATGIKPRRCQNHLETNKHRVPAGINVVSALVTGRGKQRHVSTRGSGRAAPGVALVVSQLCQRIVSPSGICFAAARLTEAG